MEGIVHLRVGSCGVLLILLDDDGRFGDVLLRLGSVLMERRILHVRILVGHLGDRLTDWDGGLIIRQFCLRLVSELLVISFLHLKFEVRKYYIGWLGLATFTWLVQVLYRRNEDTAVGFGVAFNVVKQGCIDCIFRMRIANGMNLINCNSSDVELRNPSLEPASRAVARARSPSAGVVHSLGAIGLQQDDEHPVADEHQDRKGEETAAKRAHRPQNHQEQRDDRQAHPIQGELRDHHQRKPAHRYHRM